MKNLLNKGLLALIAMTFWTTSVSAFTAVTSGNWSAAATWGGVSPGATVTAQDIIIPSGITVNLDQDVTFAGVVNSFSVDGALTSTTLKSVTLTSGSLAGSGFVTINRMTFSTLATTLFTGTLTVKEMINNGANLLFSGVANISDTLNLEAGSLVLNAGANLSPLDNSTIRINSATMTVSGGVFNSSYSYSVMYKGGSKASSVELNTITLKNLYIDMTDSTGVISLSNNVTVNGILDMSAGKLDLTGRTLTLLGNINMPSGTWLTSNVLSQLEIKSIASMMTGIRFTAGSALDYLTVDYTGFGNVQLLSPLNIAGTVDLKAGDFVLESGSSLVMNTGSMVEVEAGSLMESGGTFDGALSYGVAYLGTDNTSGVELTGAGLTDLSIDLSSTSNKIIANGDIIVDGIMDMVKGKLDLNGKMLTLNGTLNQIPGSAFSGSATSDLVLNLTSSVGDILYFDTIFRTLETLTVNLPAAETIILGTGLSIADELILTSGKLDVADAVLIIQSAASISGYSEARYIVTSGIGKLQMAVNAAAPYVTFPIGTALNYSPGSIQQTAAGTSGNFTMSAMNGVYSSGTTGANLALVLSVVDRTWLVESALGVTVNMNLKLAWSAASEVNGFDRLHAYISHYVSPYWDLDLAAAASAGTFSTFETERMGILSLSPFAVADTVSSLAAVEDPQSLSLNVYPNPSTDFVNLEVLNSADKYAYQITDLTGKMLMAVSGKSGAVRFDVSVLGAGYYFIQATNMNTGQVSTKPFIRN